MPLDLEKLYTIPDVLAVVKSDMTEAFPGLAHVDLGGGNNPADGTINVDFFHPSADIKLNLFEPGWGKALREQVGPIAYAHSSHFLEHVPDFLGFFRELDEVMVEGGHAVFITPYYSSIRATQDPTHKQFISEARYLYLSRKWREAQGAVGLSDGHYLADVDFTYAYAPIFLWNEEYQHITNQDILKRHRAHTPNSIDDIIAILAKGGVSDD